MAGILRERGYECNGWRLGDKVKWSGKEHEIIGFDEVSGDLFIAISIDIPNSVNISTDYQITSYCKSDIETFYWVCPDEIELIKEYKNEEVLKLEYLDIFGQKTAIRITYQNFDVLPRGGFRDEELKIYSVDYPDFDGATILYILGKNEKFDNNYFTVNNKIAEDIKERVRKLNEKYSKKEFPVDGDTYYYIDEFGEIKIRIYNNCYVDEKHKEIFNAFKTKEKAEKARDKILKILKEESDVQ